MSKLQVGLALAVLVLGSSPAWSEAPAKAWDQEAVTKLAGRLTEQTLQIQVGVGRHSEGTAADTPRRIVLHDVNFIHRRAISLETALRAGEGHDETEPVFRRLMTGVRNAKQDAKRFPEIEKVRGHIEKAGGLLQELSAYYAVGE
jgi:uncharacterized membrane protein YccC